jgi:biopolymer transport protein ExbD
LVSCVQVASKLAPACTQQTADIFLLIDARTDASKVMALFHMLRNQGFNHFNLVAHCQ